MIGIAYGYYVKNGGISRYISEYTKNLCDSSKTDILTLENSIEHDNSKIRIIDCDRDKTFMSFIENANFSKAVNNISKEYSAIHIHGLYDIIPELYTAHICLKRYFDQHKELFGEAGAYMYNNTQMLDLEVKLCSKLNSDKLVVVSDKLATELSDVYGYNRDNIKVIKGASRFNTQIPKEIDKSDKKGYTIGFIGGNLYSKGIIFMKDIFNSLASKGISIHCIGAGCDDIIQKYITKNAKFTSQLFGKIDLDQQFYESLDLFLCLSIYDSYSLSALEAMSLNIPVISSNNTGLFDDNKSSNLARVNDVTNIKEVSFLIEKTLMDNKYQQDVVLEGFNIANQLSWMDVASDYDKLYSKLL
jgi:glycosyltransferase involved in cell wall biosynthesis